MRKRGREERREGREEEEEGRRGREKREGREEGCELCTSRGTILLTLSCLHRFTVLGKQERTLHRSKTASSDSHTAFQQLY